VTGRLSQHPLLAPLLVGLILRLVAAQFSTGYLMHDDHFMVVEVAASWADGEDYNNWLPWNQSGTPKAHPANFAYASTQYLVFKLLQGVGIEHPGNQAFILRVLHGLYSCLTILLGFFLARCLHPHQPKAALLVAWLLAAGGFWPLLSVHQLVEVVSIPPLMLAFWMLARKSELNWSSILWTGIGIGIATGLRYQCGIIGLGLIPVLLLERKWKDLLGIGAIALSTFFLMQAPDLFVWGEPFVQLRGYIEYNQTHAGNYPTGPWYQYILTLMGLMVPPVSLMLLWGAFHRGKSAPATWWRVAVPVVGFLLFHSVFINKQERFILPVVPALITLGTVGWSIWHQHRPWWGRHSQLHRGLWIGFWVINIALLGVSLTYEAKKSRVEAMGFLYESGATNFALIQVDSGAMPPQFYSGRWTSYHIDNRRDGKANPPAKVAAKWCVNPPEYILFQGHQHLGEAIQAYKADLPGLRYVTTIQSGRIDQWLSRLNPINSSERIMVYAVEDALPCP
jgi:hypothetical protein